MKNFNIEIIELRQKINLLLLYFKAQKKKQLLCKQFEDDVEVGSQIGVTYRIDENTYRSMLSDLEKIHSDISLFHKAYEKEL